MGDSIRKKAFVYQMNNKGGYKEYAAFIAGAESRDGEVVRYKMALGTAKAELKAKELIIKSLQNPWVSVEERLPEPIRNGIELDRSDTVLLMVEDSSHYIALGFYDCVTHDWYMQGHGHVKDVTHWMSIPKLNKS